MKGLFLPISLAILLGTPLPVLAMQPTDDQSGSTSIFAPLVITGTIIGAGVIGIAYYKHYQKEMQRKREEALKQEAYDYCMHCLHDAKRITLAWEKLASKNPETPPVQIWTLRRIQRLFSPWSLSRSLALEKKNRHLEASIENLTTNCPADPLYVKKLPWLQFDRTSNKIVPNKTTLSTIVKFYDTLRETISTQHHRL